LPAIAKRTPNTLHGVAASVGNRIVVKNWFPVDPQQLAIHFQSSDPKLYRAISEIIGTDVIYDIYYVKGWAGSKKPKNLVLELLVAWVYKSTLELGDITFLDPTHPIPPGSRRFPDQTHKGLGLLPVLMKNLSAKSPRTEVWTGDASRRSTGSGGPV